ncbi:MAG: phytanoyl-CoA dioxygenase family protein [Pseudomonadota bacterium]
MPILVKDSFEYSRTELAGTYPSDAGSQVPVPAEHVEVLLDTLDRQGYVVMPGLLDSQQVQAIREDILPRLQHQGRNNFEGLSTRRLYSVIEKTLVCNPLVEHPLVLALLDRLLLPNYLLSQLQAIQIQPGEAAQPLHYDDGFYPVPRPRPALGAATIWALDDFTADNGATLLLPGSQRWGDRGPAAEDLDRLIPAVMPAGSLLFFTGTLWHGGGANLTQVPRLGITAQYCAPWCRQQENFSLSVSRARAKACSAHLQRLLGYSIHGPFMGFVDGRHPKRLLE